MTRTVHRAAAALAIAASILAVAGCGPQSVAEARQTRAASGTGDLVIGAPWPWAAGEDEGILYRKGLEMGVDEVNARGGVHGRRLRLLFEDDQQSVNEGLRIAQRLISNPDVIAVIGHLQSYVSVPTSAIYENGEVVMLSPFSTDPALTANGFEHVFRMTFTDQETGRRMAEHAARQGYRRVAIYYVRTEYGRGLANAFEERAGEVGIGVAARASYDAVARFEARAFEPTLRQWKLIDVDAIFLAGEIPVAGHLIAEMRRMGLTQPILGGDAMSFPALIAAAGPAAEGTVVAASFHSAERRPEVARFAKEFRARNHTEPDPAAAVAYDAVHALARAMEGAEAPTAGSVAARLRSLPPMEGVTGRISFDKRGDLVGDKLVKLVVRNGRFEPLPDSAPPRR
ncbi:MAG TPA: ABC transporter substrate-binding protein [Longimicrobium sp.]|jgi:branched-chain amino acid transport system substrate-binding protein